jgi:cytidine deaminase
MEKLMQAAIQAKSHAYVPYSKFPVGAALLCEDEVIVAGCNVENASYGLCNCAERTALFTAVAEGRRSFFGLAVIADTEEPVAPCGACRQVLVEFCPPDMKVWLSNLKGEVMETTVSALLPGAFTREALNGR